MMRRLLLGLALVGCSAAPDHTDTDSGVVDTDEPPDTGDGSPDWPSITPVSVVVTLDGAPVQGATLAQGGGGSFRWSTDADGGAEVDVDGTIEGDKALVATHPEARAVPHLFRSPPEPGARVIIALERYDADNPDYEFGDPGEPDRRPNTAQCAHCHVEMSRDWVDSAHRGSASGVQVQDLYAGVAAAWSDPAACALAGGQWWLGLQPGTGASVERCYLGHGALPDLNTACGDDAPCDDVAEDFGGCADCHAPAIDGALGGRDLLEAREWAYEYGVHCDLCHKVESVDLADAAPGVAGRLHVLRPQLPDGIPQPPPVIFGPYDDVGNPFMAPGRRDHYTDGALCAGCHELDQPALVPGAALDPARWPDGRLPIHSTYSEWLDGPYSAAASCNRCHMPINGVSGNSADLGNEFDLIPGITAGWYRPYGEVLRHTWLGPQRGSDDFLSTAAGLSLDVVEEGAELVVRATVTNTGAGHALPTGEPMRSLVLRVQAHCDGVEIPSTGGHAVPDFGGAIAQKPSTGDWSIWADARPGDLVRVVRREGWHDYSGPGPFGDGRFSVEQRGMPIEVVAGASTVLSVSDGSVVFDVPLPLGDVAYLVDSAFPQHGAAATFQAGAPGFGFGKVLMGPDGARGVPHHLAVDVVSDNRLLPQDSWTSEHRFAGGCDGPDVRASLVYRTFPLELAAQKGWSVNDEVWVERSW